MGYSLIESLPGGDSTFYEIDGSRFDLPSLVEDAEGIRIMLVRPSITGDVSQAAWHRAHAAGAAAILRHIAENTWDFVLAERFLEQRVEASDAMVGPVYRCGFLPVVIGMEPPLYRDLLESGAAAPSVGGDPWAPDFVHLHTHTEYSPPDGYSRLSELVDIVVGFNQGALGVADHGNCVAHIELQQKCDEAGIKPVFGMEAYFQNDRFARGSENRYTYWHLLLFAMNDAGLKNLWALSTEGYVDGLYDGHPRIDWDTLQRYQEGLICTTACLRGPVARPLTEGNEDEARINFARLHEIFGDRLYAEIHTNDLDKQIAVNKTMVKWAAEMGVPLVAAVDSHYPHAEDYINHQAMLVLRSKKASIEDDGSEGGMFAGKQDYSMISGDEVFSALAYLGEDVAQEAMANTVRIADRCTAKIVPIESIPVYSKPTPEWPDPVAHDAQRLIDICLDNITKVTGKKATLDEIEARIKEELDLIIEKKFPGYFLMVRDYVWAAKHRDQLDPGILDAIEARIPEPVGGYRRTPILVGPGRGSGGGSVIAYLSDIIEIDPLEAELLFARFLTPGRNELPDFDLDFPVGERDWIKEYVRYRWGVDHVVTVGTVGRMQVKAAVGEVARIFSERFSVEYADVQRMSKIADKLSLPLAGAPLKWDDFAEEEDVKVYAGKYPEMWALSEKFYQRWRAYGQHPAGVVISTDDPLTGSLPLRLDKSGALVAQWDMEALGWYGLVKFDLLTIRNLDTVQFAIDLIAERYGRRINPYEWRDERDDPYVWEQLSAGHTLGVFQVNTSAGTRMVKEFQPTNLQDMAAVITLVRPGPKRSGLTDTYLKRKKGSEAVSVPDPRLATVLSGTYGCLVYQEDIMATTMVLATYDGTEADGVRKILGKKQVEKVEAAGRVFVERAVQNDTDIAVAAALWVQMAEFAKYSFNKAHAYGYGVLAYWTAWFKFNFPLEFATAALSTVDDADVPSFVHEARRLGYAVLPPDINGSGIGFTPGQMEIRYGLDSIFNVGAIAAKAVIPYQPFVSFEDFLERKGGKCNAGHVKNLVRAGAFDSLFPNRRALEAKVLWDASGEGTKCVMKDESAVNVNGLPCTFDWSSEPHPVGKTGRPLKNPLAVPKKCTIKCRHYTPPGAIDISVVLPYNEADIRGLEKELLGIHLSSTVFDQFAEEDRKLFATVEEIDSGPVGEYPVGGIITRVTDERTSVNGSKYVFVDIETESGILSMGCFSKTWERYKGDLRKDALVAAVVEKNNRGVSLQAVMPARGA